MLRTTKNMKEKYEKIQNLLFALIPEKWEAVYLYASVISDDNRKQNGEMFFYYLPKGILKKKPINVYEVPKRFNINEEQYLEFVKELYNSIKDLKQDFIDTDQELWTSITISIANFKFRIEYSYEDIPLNEKENNERHVIWRYKYLKIGGEKKEERKILENYFENKEKRKTELYETGLYIKTDNNAIVFDREDVKAKKEKIIYEKEDTEEIPKQEVKKLDINDKVKLEENESELKKEIEKDSKSSKNQILNM